MTTRTTTTPVCALGHKRKSYECPACATEPQDRHAWGWYRGRTSSKAIREALDAVMREHSPALECSPTIFDWTKVRAYCFCGWRGPWITWSEGSLGPQDAKRQASDQGGEHWLEVAPFVGRHIDGEKGTSDDR